MKTFQWGHQKSTREQAVLAQEMPGLGRSLQIPRAGVGVGWGGRGSEVFQVQGTA